MEKYSILIVLLTVVLIVSAADYNSSSIDQNNTVNSFTQVPHMTKDFGMLAKRIITRKCIIDYSFTCLKMDLVKLIDRLNSKRRFQIIPGLSMVKSSGRYKSSLSSSLLFHIAQGKNETLKELDLVLLHKLEDFMKSFSIELQPEDPLVLQYIKNLGDEIINTLSTVKNNQTGRGKKGAILWSAGVLAALGFAAVAAVAGKALMASILALMISALSTLRSGGSGSAAYKTAHYEIISKPVHYSAPAMTGPAHYYDHDHLHSSSYSPAYDYARTISETIAPVAEEAYVKDSSTFKSKQEQN